MKTMFAVEQNRTEIPQGRGEVNRHPVNVRQQECAALPWAGRVPAETLMAPGSSTGGMALASGGQ